MGKQVVSLSASEERLIEMMRRLPPDRIAEVLDFAEFLAHRDANRDNEGGLGEGETDVASTAEDARWEALLASDDSQRLLERMADEALTQIKAGQAKPIVFTDEGEIAHRLWQ